MAYRHKMNISKDVFQQRNLHVQGNGMVTTSSHACQSSVDRICSCADAYCALGVDASASKAEVRKAYVKMSLIVHVDKCEIDNPQGEAFKKLTKAYEAASASDQSKDISGDVCDIWAQEQAHAQAKPAPAASKPTALASRGELDEVQLHPESELSLAEEIEALTELCQSSPLKPRLPGGIAVEALAEHRSLMFVPADSGGVSAVTGTWCDTKTKTSQMFIKQPLGKQDFDACFRGATNGCTHSVRFRGLKPWAGRHAAGFPNMGAFYHKIGIFKIGKVDKFDALWTLKMEDPGMHSGMHKWTLSKGYCKKRFGLSSKCGENGQGEAYSTITCSPLQAGWQEELFQYAGTPYTCFVSPHIEAIGQDGINKTKPFMFRYSAEGVEYEDDLEPSAEMPGQAKLYLMIATALQFAFP